MRDELIEVTRRLKEITQNRQSDLGCGDDYDVLCRAVSLLESIPSLLDRISAHENKHGDYDFGKHIIWRSDGVTSLKITVDDEHCPDSDLEWNINEEAAQETGDGGWLTLNEISDQIKELGLGQIIEVRQENTMYGAIFQFGNSADEWREQATTVGYM